jgi:diguanylate cyclase (GGDEF)-like protein
MADRALIVEGDGPVAAALQGHLEAAGLAVDRADPGDALRLLRTDHALAVVRAERPDLAAALKQRDPTLAVLALHRDDDALLAAGEGGSAVDGVLVGPLLRPAVAAAARAMARLAGQGRRLAEIERATAPGREGFELHRRLVVMEVKRARRYRYPVALVLVSIDGWDAVAAALDSEARAALPAAILSILARSLRAVDLPVLHSGDRYLIVLPHTAAEGALTLAGRLCAHVAARPGPPRLTASAGVAAFDGAGEVSFSSLVAEARRGLERARAAGGGRAERGSGPAQRKVESGR